MGSALGSRQRAIVAVLADKNLKIWQIAHLIEFGPYADLSRRPAERVSHARYETTRRAVQSLVRAGLVIPSRDDYSFTVFYRLA